MVLVPHARHMNGEKSTKYSKFIQYSPPSLGAVTPVAWPGLAWLDANRQRSRGLVNVYQAYVCKSSPSNDTRTHTA